MSTIQQNVVENVAENVADMAGAALDHVADLVDRGAVLLDESPLAKVTRAAPEPKRRHRGRWLAVVGVATLTVGWVVVSRRRAGREVRRRRRAGGRPARRAHDRTRRHERAPRRRSHEPLRGRPERVGPVLTAAPVTPDVTDLTRAAPNSRAFAVSRSVLSLPGSTFPPEGRHARAT